MAEEQKKRTEYFTKILPEHGKAFELNDSSTHMRVLCQEVKPIFFLSGMTRQKHGSRGPGLMEPDWERDLEAALRGTSMLLRPRTPRPPL